MIWLSSVASPICQEGQSERIFPILAFSSRFFLFFSIFFPIFPLYFLIFSLFLSIFDNFSTVKGGTLPPYPYTGYATDLASSTLVSHNF